MYIHNNVLNDYTLSYPLERIAPLTQILFLDIETTGLSALNSHTYMIGLAYYELGQWHIEQWMAEQAEEEIELLQKLSAFLPRFTHMIHFNGNRFDIPYLLQRAEKLSVNLTFDNLCGIDIYKRVSPLKQLLALPNCRQKSIEEFLGIHRIDKYSGGELIDVYNSYVQNHSKEDLDLLIQHNYDDMKGMLDIAPILAYSDLFEETLTISRVELLKSKSVDDAVKFELSLTLKTPFSVPKKLFAHFDGNFLYTEDNRVIIKVPVYEEELKFFYSNYKDYYYIPSLDAAYHKSVSGHLDASLRKAATPSTCFTKKSGVFLKQYDILVEPFFKKDYRDKETYFELTDETKKDRKLFEAYANHMVKVICEG